MRRSAPLLLVAALGLIAGCGGGGSSSTTTANTGRPTATTPTQTGASARAGGQAHAKGAAGGAPLGSPSQAPRSKGGDNSIRTFGQAASAADRAAITRALQDYLAARAAGDSARACSLLASRIAQGLARFAAAVPNLQDRSCAGMLDRLSSQLPAQASAQFSPPRVTGVRVDVDRAFVLYRGAHDARLAMSMVRESGAWKVGELTAAPAP